MDKLGKAAALFIFGAVMHGIAPFIDSLPRGWGNLTRSAIGWLMCWIGILPFANDYKDVPNQYTRMTLRFFTGNIPVGLGVVSAYILSHFVSQQEGEK